MSLRKHNLNLVKKAYSLTIKALQKQRAIFLPFLIFSLFEFVTLIILFLAPRMPLRLVFGPIIRTFWGERFLHYPINFVLLPKLASLSRMALTVAVGSLLTGVAVCMVLAIYHKKEVNFNSSLKTAIKKYANLFLIVATFVLIFYFAVKAINLTFFGFFRSSQTKFLFLKASFWLGPFLTTLNFLVAIIIQAVFIYAIPAIIVDNQKLFKAIIHSFKIFKKYFLETILLVGLPMLIYIPVIILNSNTAFLINRVFPEFILVVSVLSIVISSLIIDPLITISTTYLYLSLKES